MPTKRQIFRSSIVVGFFSLLGGLTGILVETSIAAKLGLSRSSDAFYVAFTIPYIITNLISATGQFSLVPFFATVENRQAREELWRRFSYAANLLLVGLGAMTLLGIASTPWLVRGVAPGFTSEQVHLATQLGRWLFLILVPAGISEVFRSFLFSQGRFGLASAAGLLRNVVVIASILFTYRRYGAYSIALGYLGGYLLQFVVLGGQILISFPARYAWVLSGSGAAFRNLRGAGTAQVGAAAGWQGVVIVERIIASFLPAGTLTALNYGFKIMSSLAELLGGSVGTATLPALSSAVARRAHEEEHKTFRDTLEISLALVAPATVFCLMLDRNIIRLIFERGNFTPEATALMSLVFFYYSLSLVLYSFIRVLTFYLFARNEFGAFFRLSMLLYALNVGFDLLFVGALRLGAIGIPLGLLASLILTCGLLVHRNLAGLRMILDRSLASYALKNLLGSILAALAVWSLRPWLELPSTEAGNFLYLCVLCGTGSLAFFATLAASRAVPIAHLATVWRSSDDT